MMFKILFLGDSNVGKSCLIKRFIEDKFDDHLQSTICIDFKIKRWKEYIKLYIWEITSIQDCRSYLKNSEGVYIMFDITNRNSFLNLPKYIKEVKDNNKEDIPIIILGSKLDCESNRQVLYKDGKKFADSMNIPYLEISAKEGKYENIQNLFELIHSKIESLNKKLINEKELEELSKKKQKCLMM